MSTRCNIGIYEDEKSVLENPDIILYKHSDGYPENTLPLLKEFMNNPLNERNRNDYEYQSAWLLHSLINDHIRMCIEHKYNENHIGYGICKDIHGDIEYYYAIYPNRIEVYNVPGFNGEYRDFKLVEKVII